jgi:hypothetical protein
MSPVIMVFRCQHHRVFGSVLRSGMFILDPDFYPSRITDLGSQIPDPKTATEERSEKNVLSYFLCGHKFPKIENYFSFEVQKKKIWANFQRIIELFTQKIVTKLSKIWFGIPDPWVKKASDPGSRIRNTALARQFSTLNYRFVDTGELSSRIRKGLQKDQMDLLSTRYESCNTVYLLFFS